MSKVSVTGWFELKTVRFFVPFESLYQHFGLDSVIDDFNHVLTVYHELRVASLFLFRDFTRSSSVRDVHGESRGRTRERTFSISQKCFLSPSKNE